MNKNQSITLVLVIVIAGFFSFSAYTYAVIIPEEIHDEIVESQAVANNWRNIPIEEINCAELRGKLLGLAVEDFNGKDIILDALIKISEEANC